MNETFYNPTFWHWLVLGCIFLGLEIVVPGAFFLWLSFAAGASAILKFILPDLGWAAQFVAFSAFCIISLFAWKRFAKDSQEIETDQPTLNQRGQAYKGRVLVVSQAIVNGVGKVRVDDSQWKVVGDDAPIGTKVKVIEVNGSIFSVVPA